MLHFRNTHCRVSKKPPTAKCKDLDIGISAYTGICHIHAFQYHKESENACYARHFAYCTNRTLTYHLYADGSGLFVLTASLTSASFTVAVLFLDDTPHRLYNKSIQETQNLLCYKAYCHGEQLVLRG